MMEILSVARLKNKVKSSNKEMEKTQEKLNGLTSCFYLFAAFITA